MQQISRPLFCLVFGLFAASSTGCGAIADTILVDNPVIAAGVGVGKAVAAQAPMSLEEEKAYGDALAIKIIKRYGGLMESRPLRQYVGLVGNAIAANSARPNYTFRFGVLRSEGVNAVSAPGGWVFITVGALRKMRNEAELAGVLAHEIAHITERHAVDIIQNLRSGKALTEAAGRMTDALGTRGFFRFADGFLETLFTTGLPKKTEYKADALGTKLLVAVGYHPAGLRDFLQAMVPKGAPPKKDKFYKTHPDTQERVDRINELLKKLQANGPKLQQRYERRARTVLATIGTQATTVSAPPPSAGDQKKTAPPAGATTERPTQGAPSTATKPSTGSEPPAQTPGPPPRP